MLNLLQKWKGHSQTLFLCIYNIYIYIHTCTEGSLSFFPGNAVTRFCVTMGPLPMVGLVSRFPFQPAITPKATNSTVAVVLLCPLPSNQPKGTHPQGYCQTVLVDPILLSEFTTHFRLPILVVGLGLGCSLGVRFGF